MRNKINKRLVYILILLTTAVTVIGIKAYFADKNKPKFENIQREVY